MLFAVNILIHIENHNELFSRYSKGFSKIAKVKNYAYKCFISICKQWVKRNKIKKTAYAKLKITSYTTSLLFLINNFIKDP